MNRIVMFPRCSQKLCRHLQERGMMRGGPEPTFFDVMHLVIADEGSGAGGMAQASYVIGVDDPEGIVDIERRMQKLCDAINVGLGEDQP